MDLDVQAVAQKAHRIFSLNSARTSPSIVLLKFYTMLNLSWLLRRQIEGMEEVLCRLLRERCVDSSSIGRRFISEETQLEIRWTPEHANT